MKVEVILRLENDQEDNTWYSTGTHEKSDIQLHIAREWHIAMNMPRLLLISFGPVEGFDRKDSVV